MSVWQFLGILGVLISLAGNVAWIWTIVEEKRDERWVRKFNIREALADAEHQVRESHEQVKEKLAT